MDDNEDFISKWKPIHEKAIVSYVLVESLIYLSCTALVTLIFLWIYPSLSANNQALSEYGIYFVIGLNVMTIVIFTGLRLMSWFRGEKRYRKIMNKDF